MGSIKLENETELNVIILGTELKILLSFSSVANP